ncbi:integrator complex subunit 6-like [Cricetulus griseus]|uniref:integrator complex subunit 6-like n=1 Tax=Cricetulus griseus TaxID=10029 RepID=UPI000F7422C0|nr:integrator complex subunit 6-like [Cricetulus griseus]XP_035310036.1 integrator complex subunit 6-like [Cricetulus griseus]
MAEEGEEFSVCSENEKNPAGDAVGPPLPKVRRIVTSVPVEIKEGEPHLTASVIEKEEGATVGPKAQEGMVEGGPTTTKGSPKWVPAKNAPFDKSACFSSAGLIPEGGEATFTGGIVSRENLLGAQSFAALTEGKGVSSEYLVSREKINADIKRELMKEIRRYGRKYERIFKLLEEVQGPLEVRKQFFEFTIKEAGRFKRRHLIQCLEKKREEMLSPM